MKFDFDDIILTPRIISMINSRKEVDMYIDGMLPLFTAPMNSVVDITNSTFFERNEIRTIIPRGIVKNTHSFEKNRWCAYSLDEFENHFLINERFNPNGYPFPSPSDLKEQGFRYYALIDIANGHMYRLYQLAKKAKKKYGDDLCLMVGNIANPQTYVEFAKIGVDYIRCGIGNGGACLTTQQTGIGYPMGSLISEIYQLKRGGNYTTKIVADGGFKKYADIIKALALGADYVMLGSIFNKALESAAITYVDDSEASENNELNCFLDQMELKYKDTNNFGYKAKLLTKLLKQGKLYKEYRGMSTKEVQGLWNKNEIKTSEGITKKQIVEYTLEGWCQNFKDYLSSAMSYTGSYNLEEFKNSNYELITPAAFKRYNK